MLSACAGRCGAGALPMPRYKLTLEYAGTRYTAGRFRRTRGRCRASCTRALRKALGSGAFETYGSGRTDAGVHALAQVAHVDLAATLPPPTLVARVNDALPHDINVARGRARAGAVPRASQRGRAQLPLSDRVAPDGVRQAVRLVGARTARPRGDARRRAALTGLRRLPRVHRRRPGREVDARAGRSTCQVERAGGARSSCASSDHTFSGRWSAGSSACSSRSAAAASGRRCRRPAGAATRTCRHAHRAGIRPVSRAGLLRAAAGRLAAAATSHHAGLRAGLSRGPASGTMSVNSARRAAKRAVFWWWLRRQRCHARVNPRLIRRRPRHAPCLTKCATRWLRSPLPTALGVIWAMCMALRRTAKVRASPSGSASTRTGRCGFRVRRRSARVARCGRRCRTPGSCGPCRRSPGQGSPLRSSTC